MSKRMKIFSWTAITYAGLNIVGMITKWWQLPIFAFVFWITMMFYLNPDLLPIRKSTK